MPEIGIEAVHVVLRKRSRTNQAHVADDYAPQLRQLVEAHSTDQIADEREYARVVRELEVALPLAARVRMSAQVLLQPALGVAVPGAQLGYVDRPAAPANARLTVEGAAAVDHPARPGEFG